MLKQTTKAISNTMPATRRKEMAPRTLPIITVELLPDCSELVIDVVSGSGSEAIHKTFFSQVFSMQTVLMHGPLSVHAHICIL